MNPSLDYFQPGDNVFLIGRYVADYSDVLNADIDKQYQREYLIPAGSRGEIIGRALDFYGEIRYPVRFFDTENYPQLFYSGEFEDDPVPRPIGPGHYIPISKLKYVAASPQPELRVSDSDFEILFS